MLQNTFFKVRQILFITISALYIFSIFFPHLVMDHVLAWLVATGLFFSLPAIKKGLGRVALLLLILGTGVLLFTGAPWVIWSEALRQMLDVLMLVFFARLLEFPIEFGEYSKAVYQFFFRRAKSMGQIFIASNFLAYLFGTIALVATIPITFYTLIESIKQVTSFPEKFLSPALVRGRSLALLWTPISPVIAFSLSFSGLRWVELFPYGFLLSIIGLIISFLLFIFSPFYTQARLENLKIEKDKSNTNKIVQFVIAILSLIGSILIIDHFWDRSVIDILVLSILCFSATWAFLIGYGRNYLRRTINFFMNEIPYMETQYSLFIGAGFFVVALQYQETWLSHSVIIIVEALGEMTFLFIIPFFIWGLSLLGINPIIGIALVGKSLAVSGNLFPQMALSIALVSGGATAFLLSPFTATSLITAGLVDKSPFQVGLSWNWLFALIMLCVTYVFIAILMVV